MSTTNDIPFLSTSDLWNNYVDVNYSIEEYFKPNTDDFLVTRIEDLSNKFLLPTPPHRRNVVELVLVTKGKVVRGANLNKLELNKNDFHFLLPEQISTVDFISEDVKGYYCQFSLETIIQLYHKEHILNEFLFLSNHTQDSPVKLNLKTATNVIAFFERMIEEYQSNNDYYLIDAYIITLLYEVKNCVTLQTFKNKSKAAELIEKFKHLIIKNNHQEHNVTYYANQLSITPNHLNKITKQVTGKNASNLICDMIILEAKVLLKHTDLSISEIAFKLGFLDQSYFSRFFKKNTEVTPKEYKSKKD